MVVAGKYVRIIWNPNLVNDPLIRKFREWRYYL